MEKLVKEIEQMMEQMMDQKMDQLEQKLDQKMDQKIGILSTEINGIREEMSEMNTRIDKLEDKIEAKAIQLETKIEAKAIQLETKIEAKAIQLETKIDNVKEEINGKLFVVEKELNDKIDTLYDGLLLDRDKNLERRDKLVQLDRRVSKTELDILVHDKKIFNLDEKVRKITN